MGNKENTLRSQPGNPHATQRPVIAVSSTLDHMGVFISAVALVDAINEQPNTHYTPESLLSFFLVKKYHGHEMLIHHADHDMGYFLPHLETMVSLGYDVTFTMNGTEKMIYISVKYGRLRWYIRDTFSLLPMSIDDMRKLAGTLPGASTVKVLIQAYKELSKTLLQTFEIRPMHTIASTAMRAFTTTIPAHHIHYRQRRQVEDTARDAYYGGMIFQTTDQTVQNVTKVDVNAMYAHAMRQGVPTRGGMWVGEEIPGKPGIYHCKVTPPDNCPFPFVPKRDDRGFTTYPRKGTFNTTLCSNTMKTARDFGYKIEVSTGFAFQGLDNVFGDFVDKCEQLELEYKERGARSVIKLLRNSLYGKFGQKTQAKEYILTTTPEAYANPEKNEYLTFVINFRGEPIYNLWWRNIEIKRPSIQPVWAAWITSEARDTLTRMIYALGPSQCHYGDTDSIVVNSCMAHTSHIAYSPKYGDWKIDGVYTDFRVMAPKCWIGQSVDGTLESVEYRMGGIPRSAFGEDEILTLLATGKVSSRDYLQHNRAINTIGSRPIVTPMQKEVTLKWDTPGIIDSINDT